MTPLLIQILMKPEVWRLVGFASTVVGLLCYALSSSFNHLFGEWNLLKIYLYSVFSFIICLVILFAKVWQRSRSLLLRAHLAVLVLTATSVYSFFYDKAVNGKPDAYSLISCGAFAIMSLSLSRQTHFGFEVDLLYFFLGFLIIQFMKIKLLLGIVGAGISYSLIILPSSLDCPPENECVGPQDQVVIQVDSPQANTDSATARLMPQLNVTQILSLSPPLSHTIPPMDSHPPPPPPPPSPSEGHGPDAEPTPVYVRRALALLQLVDQDLKVEDARDIRHPTKTSQFRRRQLGQAVMDGRDVESSERSKGSEGEVQGIKASPSPPRKSRNNDWVKRTIHAPQVANTEMPPEDGFTWRKYGQKDMLGFEYPRSYYRCTQQKFYACPAKKQVQRLDHNPNIFEVTYRGEHTCHMSSTTPSSFPPPQLLVDVSKDITQSTISPQLT